MPRRPRADETGGLFHALKQAVRTSAQRGSPFGDAIWVESTAKRLNLGSSLRPRGRPRIHFDAENEINES